MISKSIFRHGKQYFVFKIFCSAHKKTPEMKELAPNKQLLKILAPNSQKQKIRAFQKSTAGSKKNHTNPQYRAIPVTT